MQKEEKTIPHSHVLSRIQRAQVIPTRYRDGIKKVCSVHTVMI